MRTWQIYVLAGLMWIPSALFAPPTRQQELRVLISARNMLESGNFHRPEFQEQPRFRKPPMAYWLAAAGMFVTGNREEAWAGRLFFVIISMGGIALLVRIAGPAGYHSALVAVLSFGLWRYAPLAETDMIQLCGILLFFYAWQRQASLLAGLGISFACLSKGPAGFLIPFLCLLLLIRFYRPEKKFILSVLFIPLLLIGSWILYLLMETSGLDQMQKDLSATFVDSDHPNPWYYYFYTLPLLILPGGLLVFSKQEKKEQASPVEIRTALAWLGVTMLLLMLTVSKQRHYTLLLLPPAAWLIGMRIQSEKRKHIPLLLIGALGIGIATGYYYLTSENYKNAKFLSSARPLIMDAGTLHVVGINSAIFDYHLGRHVENTDSVNNALTRAAPGDAVVIIRPLKNGQVPPATDAIPLLSQTDELWERNLYLKQLSNSTLDSPTSKRE